ncbi:amino acid ABC transporter substrate-binding protein [Stutzerimonas kirkiae]|uniref:amino acid ABC transporter substrate-binding protein n=1 Tax=Stutzerimonas kirkiae TaxID=2211392 RepID=UPI0010385431|nr:amino acid ABC transporter substrate-binding protein [Stutzerimonas kirkiae]TBV09742.1 amino acid ABC transporter substrate-binding protein [Stutzerimonas kirkiae]TBV13528.1 amino acid ABC transporter substrate-binding protein [Stutzerimonas kirkiae]
MTTHRQEQKNGHPRALLLGLLLAASGTWPVLASTLEHIHETGVIRFGYGGLPPFAYQADGQVVGYSIELCQRIARRLQKQLGLERLAIEYVLHTANKRVQMLDRGDYDIDCDTASNTSERRRNVAFSPAIFYSATRYATHERQQVRRFDDLKGRSVSVTRGTVSIGQVNQANRLRRLNLAIIPSDSYETAFELLGTGRVSAFIMDDIILQTMIAGSPEPEKYRVSEETLSAPIPYGFMMRLDDRAFELVVRDALLAVLAAPDMTDIYQRWFQRPIPGLNINLDRPMDAQLMRHIANAIEHAGMPGDLP